MEPPHTLDTLVEQMRVLAEKVGTLADRVDHLDTKVAALPHFPRILFEWRMPPSRGDLVSVLRYHEASLRTAPGSYYWSFGGIYGSAAISMFIGSGNGAVLPVPLRLLAALVYFLVAMGNISCIFLPTLRHQVTMAVMTVTGALFGLSLSIGIGIHLGSLFSVIAAMVLWAIIIAVHVRFASGIAGRIDQREFTQRLIDAALPPEGQAPP